MERALSGLFQVHRRPTVRLNTFGNEVCLALLLFGGTSTPSLCLVALGCISLAVGITGEKGVTVAPEKEACS